MEDRLLRDVDEGRFREICQTALEGLAAKKLNLEMLVERRARAQERRVVPETIAPVPSESAGNAAFTLNPGQQPAAHVPAGPDTDNFEEVRARLRLAFP